MKLEVGSYFGTYDSKAFLVGVATRVPENVTVSHHWKTVAPPQTLRTLWEGHEHGILAQAGYVQFYKAHLEKNRHDICLEFSRIIEKAKEAQAEKVILLCYEPQMSNAISSDRTFCHRYSLKTWLSHNYKLWCEEQLAKQTQKAAQARAAEDKKNATLNAAAKAMAEAEDNVFTLAEEALV